MSQGRRLFAAGVIRAGRRHDAVPAGACRPVHGENRLDTPLGVAGGTRPVPLRAIAEPEPDLSARYELPAHPAEPVDQVHAGQMLARAVQGLTLTRDAWRLVVRADSWSAANKAALADLIEAARTAGGGASC